MLLFDLTGVLLSHVDPYTRTHLETVRRKYRVLACKWKACSFCTLFSDSSQSKNNSIQHWWPDRKGLVSLTLVRVMWVFCMFTSMCQGRTVWVIHVFILCSLTVLQAKIFLLWRSGKETVYSAPAPFFLSCYLLSLQEWLSFFLASVCAN